MRGDSEMPSAQPRGGRHEPEGMLRIAPAQLPSCEFDAADAMCLAF